MVDDKLTFIKISKGGKIKGGRIENNTMIGDGHFIDNAGEIEDVSISRNSHIIPPMLKPLVAAIKKPSANDNAGWKIMIVGSLLALGIAVFTVHYSDWFESYKEQTQTSTQEQNP